MAITKLLRIKETRHGQDPSVGLRRCIQYICNPSKTENGRWIGGTCGGLPDLAYDFMKQNKKTWDKETGSQGFHYILSFSPDDNVSPATALQIADEFCADLIPGHLYVTAAHLDTDHMHVHICFDSVNAENGLMFHSRRYDWLARIQPITDRLCDKYNLPTLDYDPSKERFSMYHAEWEASHQKDEIKKSVSWNDLIRDDIDVALSQSDDWEMFLRDLRDMHYIVRDGKYLSLQPFGKDRPVRSIRLGREYSKEELQKRLQEHDHTRCHSPVHVTYKTYGNAVLVLRSMQTYVGSGWQRGFSPMQRLFYKRWMALSHVRKPDFQTNWKYKKQVTELGKLTDDLCYLFDHDLSDVLSVQKKMAELRKKHGPDATRERKICSHILAEYADTTSFNSIIIDTHAYKAPDFSKERILKITANQALFHTVDFSAETMTIHIPGTSYVLEIHTADSRSYNNGAMLSTHLYADANYRILDQDGKFLRMTTGAQAAAYFKAKEIVRSSEEKENRNGRK